MTIEIPVVAEVDVLVVGGASAGVELAVQLRAAGASVWWVSSRPFAGEDIASAYAFWRDANERPGTALAHKLFAGEAPPTPMHVKLTLEQALVSAGVEVLLNAYPAGVVRDESGQIRGAVIATRTSWQVVLAGRVVDATIEGQLARLAGVAAPVRKGMQRCVHGVMLRESAEPPHGVVSSEDRPGWRGRIGEKDYDLKARVYTIEVDFGDGSPAALAEAETDIAFTCWTPGVYRQQEVLAPVLIAAPGGKAPSLETLTTRDGLTLLAPWAVTDAHHAALLSRPVRAMALAAQWVKPLAASLAKRPVAGALRIEQAGAKAVAAAEVRIFTDALRPGRRATRTLPVRIDQMPVVGSFDVVVVGGGTAGAPAAISAGRAGARTALIESTAGLGGVGTMGQVSTYYFGNRVGFTSEVDRGVAELETAEAMRKGAGKWTISAKCQWLMKSCREHGVVPFMRSACVGACVGDGAVRGVVMAGPMGFGLLGAGAVVDSTGCADVAALAGARTVTIGAEHVATQGTGLSGLNPNRENHNSDHTFTDDTDAVNMTSAFISAKVKFADHFDLGQLVDSRERRQIIGEISLGPADFMFERRFPDTICVASSNFDTHGYTIHPLFMLKPPTKDILWVDIPYRCLLPVGLEGVLVTGLGVSAHRDSLPVIRMQPDVQNQGYAAGLAAATAARLGVGLRQIDLKALQRHLVDIGVLPERALTDQDNFPVSEAQLRSAVADGWDTFAGLGLIFNEPARSLPLVKAELGRTDDAAKRLRLAEVLGMLGDATGLAILKTSVAESAWDKGWNYRGMGQFGLSMSALDARLVALGSCGDALAWEVLLDKARTLPMPTEFSHYRALVVAMERLHARHPDGRGAAALAQLLQRPGIGGHAQTSIDAVQKALTRDTNETVVRNNALVELHLARGVWRLGDVNRLGQKTLEAYRDDQRGHFARHAAAVLEAGKSGRETAA